MTKAGGWAGCGSPEGDEEKEELHLRKTAKQKTDFLFFQIILFLKFLNGRACHRLCGGARRRAGPDGGVSAGSPDGQGTSPAAEAGPAGNRPPVGGLQRRRGQSTGTGTENLRLSVFGTLSLRAAKPRPPEGGGWQPHSCSLS